MQTFRREFQIKLQSVQDVQEFVAIATTMGFTVMVSDGLHRVNAHCFMEMFCLDLTRALTVSAQCTDVEFDRLRQAAQVFLAS